MSQSPPRDYPNTRSPEAMVGSIDAAIDAPIEEGIDSNSLSDLLTLSSVKEKFEAEQPVSDEMIHTAVTNLFSADSHDAYRQHSERSMSKQSSVRSWLKKPSQ